MKLQTREPNISKSQAPTGKFRNVWNRHRCFVYVDAQCSTGTSLKTLNISLYSGVRSRPSLSPSPSFRGFSSNDRNVHTRLQTEFITQKRTFSLPSSLFSVRVFCCCCRWPRWNLSGEEWKGTPNWFQRVSRFKMMIDHCVEHRAQFLRQLSNLYGIFDPIRMLCNKKSHF